MDKGESIDPAMNASSYDTEQDDSSHSAGSPAIIILSIILVGTLMLLAIAACVLQQSQETERNNQRGATQDGGKKTEERSSEHIKSCLKVREWNKSNAASLKQNRPEMTRMHTGAGGVALPGEVAILQEQHETTDIETGTTDRQHQSNVDEDMGTDESDLCAICLTKFSPRHLVCESPNSDCKHVFHEKCMVSWLRQNSECPICRRDYLAAEDDSTEEEVIRGCSSNSTVSSSSDQSDAM